MQESSAPRMHWIQTPDEVMVNLKTNLEFQNAETALEVVQKYTKALQAGDVVTINAQFAPNAMIYGLGAGLDSLTVAQHKEYYL